MKRSHAIGLVVFFIYILGLPSARNLTILSNQDYVWGIGLIISGVFIAYAIIKNKSSVFSSEISQDPDDWKAGRWWSVTIRFIVPVASVILLFWWMFQSAIVLAPDEWYNLFNPFSIMTCLVQWFLVLGIFLLFNRKISNSMI